MFYVRTLVFICDGEHLRTPVDLSEQELYLCGDMNSPVGEHYFCQLCGNELTIEEIGRSLQQLQTISSTTITEFHCSKCKK
jgi:hypothetical protein